MGFILRSPSTVERRCANGIRLHFLHYSRLGLMVARRFTAPAAMRLARRPLLLADLLPLKTELDAVIWDNGRAYAQHRESSAPTRRDCP